MDTELLRTFIEVYRTRHFARAANNLFITPSAVTARIHQLEELLKAPLFIRQRNNLQLTPAGEQLLPHARTMLSLWHRVHCTISQGTAPHQLSIAVSPALWEIEVRPRLHALCKLQAPQLHLQLLGSDLILQHLTSGTVDLGILFDPPPLPDYRQQELPAVELRLYTAVPVTQALQAINEHYLHVEWGESFARQFQHHFADAAAVRLKFNSCQQALDWLLNCGGCCYLPSAIAEPYRSSERLFLVEDAATIHLRSHILYRNDNPWLSQIEELLQVLGIEGR